jgi:hypothetical protein
VPKFAPVIVTDAPTVPAGGDTLIMLGTTVNEEPLLTTPPTVTTTFPVVAPVGTVATIEVEPQFVTVVAVVPLNVTVLVPCVEPKFVPVIVTDAPTPPDAGDRLVMFGVGSTVKLTPLLCTPPTVTITLPVVAPAGTGTTMLGVAVTPLKVTVLAPWVDWKPYPWIVTDEPIRPVAGDRNWIVGALLGVA